MTLEWQAPRTDEPGYKSSCNRYMVCQSEDIWQTWKLAPGGAWFALLGNNLSDEFDARAIADADAQRRVA